MARVSAGAVGLVAAGAFAAPALASDVADLAVEAAGGTIAADASGKFSKVTLINRSEDVDAAGILVTLDISKLDQNKVKFADKDCGKPENGLVFCGIEGDVIPAGARVDWLFPLERVAGATGDAGKITVTIKHDGTDPNPKNDSVTLAVKVGDSGPDLMILADDVDQVVEVNSNGKLQFKGALKPGDTTSLLYYVANHGDQAASGVKITIKLPEGVTFTEVEDDCEYAEDNRSAVCTYENLPLIPADEDKSDKDEIYSAAGFYNLITVGSDVTAPAKLTGGTVSVEPLVSRATLNALSATAPELPKGVEGMSAADVDASDNVDGYTVMVAKAGGGGGGGGTLPVTGAEAGLIGGIGLAVVVVGGVLFLMARRRRVVLVTPGDEKSTD
ncbi:MAG TPA: LPXTG cell wall anchor domain-containing protein [Micromonospora sp.]|nr:LPXTG cell wall anchor domain-containing protein [Micromonospora sp.]